MKKVALIALFVFALTGLVLAQGLTTANAGGVKTKAIDAYGNTITAPRYGQSIYNNTAIYGYWGNQDVGYIALDWGKITDVGGDQLADEVVDGFSFSYGTNAQGITGETYSVYFFDSCTGWGNMGVQEAGFLFTGLPNGLNLPSLPPGWGWVWTITVDIEGSGYEFLVGNDMGLGLTLESTPQKGGTGAAIGSPSGMNGNGFTGTEDAFDLYFPNGTYNGSWYFGGYPWWATWPSEFFGAQDPAAAMTYYGQNSQGNQAMFYTLGTWAAGQNVRFMLRKNGSTLPGWLLASGQGQSQYIPSLDLTRLVGGFAGGTPIMMNNAFIGDFDVLDVTIPNAAGGMRIYTQGAITQLSPIPPADASNGIYSN